MSNEVQQTDTISVLKVRFKADNAKLFTVFIAYINQDTKKVDKVIAVVSRYSEIFNHDIKMSFKDLEDILMKIRWKGDLISNTSTEVTRYIEKNLLADTSKDVFKMLKKKDVRNIEELLVGILYKPIRDTQLDFDIAVETVSQNEIDQYMEERHKKEQEEKAKRHQEAKEAGMAEFKVNVPADSIMVEGFLVLAPVSGVPIYEVQEGDYIFIRLDETTPTGKEYIEKFEAKSGDYVVPIAAKVIQVQKNSRREHLVVVHLKDNVYCSIVETEIVKIKKADPLMMEKNANKDKDKEEEKVDSEFRLEEEKADKGMIIFFVIALVVLLALIAVFYFGVI